MRIMRCISKYKLPMVTPTVDSKDTVSTRPVRLRRTVKNGLIMTEEKCLIGSYLLLALME